jgi:probable DNA metabolism protein
MRQIQLAAPADAEAFRRVSRRLFEEGIHPDEVMWEVVHEANEGETPTLWREAAGLHPADSRPSDGLPAGTERHAENCSPFLTQRSPPRVPPAFIALCEQVVRHRDPGRFALMYRLLWRFVHEPALRQDPLDADVMLAQKMAHAVKRDIHKMRAFVRFRPVGHNRHVAWFEPDHHIVEANAPFFVRRFAQMRWAILTPERCVEWDGDKLIFQPGAERDAGEALWLTYYEHIFNPSRLKLATMAREMPRRYWHNLPEAALIQPLTDMAEARSQAMIAAEPLPPYRTYRAIAMPKRSTPPSSDSDHPRHFKDLAEMADAMQACRDCPIGAGATQAVCGEGPMKPTHMIVGEQPGDQEDLAGHPFVGPAGRLLSKAMAELNWPRDEVYVTNAVKHFKYELRGTRRLHKTPGQREVDICLQWLDREIEMVRPTCLVALGATAARALLGRQVTISREHGQWRHERADGIPVLVTWHPSALLRMHDEERQHAFEAWQADLKTAFERQHGHARPAHHA